MAQTNCEMRDAAGRRRWRDGAERNLLSRSRVTHCKYTASRFGCSFPAPRSSALPSAHTPVVRVPTRGRSFPRLQTGNPHICHIILMSRTTFFFRTSHPCEPFAAASHSSAQSGRVLCDLPLLAILTMHRRLSAHTCRLSLQVIRTVFPTQSCER